MATFSKYLDGAVVPLSVGWIGLSWEALMHRECIGRWGRWVLGVVTFETSVAGSAYSILGKWWREAVDRGDWLDGRGGRVCEAGKLGVDNLLNGNIQIKRRSDVSVVVEDVRTSAVVVNAAVAFDTNECEMCGVDDEAKVLQGRVGERV
jgi:hypothetical protein